MTRPQTAAGGRRRCGRGRGAHDGRPLVGPRLHVPRRPRRDQPQDGRRHDAAQVDSAAEAGISKL